ncbi:NAD(P)H-quinone oxidoreductase [Nocardioides sp. CFH 31398]|uniref:NAD(P)H-quinone oxidoreductase n=1 Tax=Nocardioides sp. CFH 31398 TaxID=2919579 RepID=UPI001F053F2B|nr:NAD(P)H-quinone oxidoreductase [Nocardioides sp. CFH 31398]MCH1865567.1 NAD(P)H-quinone oxidoreductase [Nocardioides sp. CFH 31398]
MRAVVVEEPGGPEVLRVADDVAEPEAGPGEVLLEVRATAVNRADTLQRRGMYPPPPGASDIIGLECSGTVAALGEGVEHLAVGDEVCALLAGGGYAERVAVPAGQVMPVPDGVDLVTAAGIAEVACTVWSNVFMRAGLTAGDVLLVHGGSGGIGSCAIQLAAAYDARVATTAGAASADYCRDLGAGLVVDYRTGDFVAEVKEWTDGHGADVVLDNMGGAYLPRNVDVLATEGRVVVIGMQGGAKGELDLSTLLPKRASVHATSLRGRPPAEKAEICAQVVEHVWPLISDGRVRIHVEDVLGLDDVARAHERMETGGHRGKIVLDVSGS